LKSFPVSLALVAVLSACGESTSPPTPTSIAPDAGAVTEATVGTTLGTAPTFVVRDQNGNPLAGVSVTVVVTAGGGTLTGAPTQTAAGPTSVGTWTLGTVAGPNTITVTAAGLTPLVITVNGRAGPPVSMVVVSGEGMSVLAGAVVTPSPVVQVRDQFENGVSGVTVTFGVSAGDGSLAASTATTNANGFATVPQWRLGPSDIAQTLAVTAGSLATTVNAFIQTSYFIDLRFFGPEMPAAAAEAFTAAAARIRGAVVGDLQNIDAGAGQDLASCGVPGTSISGVIDDVVIYAAVIELDGPGNVLANAGPCFVRSVGRQPVIGSMRFDAADIQSLINSGRLRDVIQHEMLHVVGIGTMWPAFGWLQGAGSGNSRFTGPVGTAACVAIGGTTTCAGGIPLETSGGAGSADSHWRESIFFNELMTPFINATFNPMSVMTIRSLDDIGYQTNQLAADSYTVAASSSSLLFSLSGQSDGWEVTEKPRFLITTNGRVTRVPTQ
jgi:hypothetical protein